MHFHLLMSMANVIGNPVTIDPHTLKKEFGHYCRVEVDVDLKSELPNSILVEREGFNFEIEVSYERIPDFCSHCSVIGHLVTSCRSLKKIQEQQEHPSKPTTKTNQLPKLKATRVYQPVTKTVPTPAQHTLPVSAEFNATNVNTNVNIPQKHVICSDILSPVPNIPQHSPEPPLTRFFTESQNIALINAGLMATPNSVSNHENSSLVYTAFIWVSNSGTLPLTVLLIELHLLPDLQFWLIHYSMHSGILTCWVASNIPQCSDYQTNSISRNVTSRIFNLQKFCRRKVHSAYSWTTCSLVGSGLMCMVPQISHLHQKSVNFSEKAIRFKYQKCCIPVQLICCSICPENWNLWTQFDGVNKSPKNKEILRDRNGYEAAIITSKIPICIIGSSPTGPFYCRFSENFLQNDRSLNFLLCCSMVHLLTCISSSTPHNHSPLSHDQTNCNFTVHNIQSWLPSCHLQACYDNHWITFIPSRSTASKKSCRNTVHRSSDRIKRLPLRQKL
ncbi:hypothetical protein LguiB_008610 [Lonicera macranthoides]